MQDPGPFTLFVDKFWISPFVFPCVVALAEKRVAFDARPLSVYEGELQLPEYRDRWLTARVPALCDGDFWLSESSAIIEYLDDALPPPRFARLLPEGARARARARQVMAWLRSDLAALREDRSTKTIFYTRTSEPLTAAGQAAADKLIRAATQLIPAGGGPIAGDWSIADAELAFALQRLVANGDPVPTHLRAYAEEQWARPSVRAFVERPRPPYEGP
jgi:glutathione S-transferase